MNRDGKALVAGVIGCVLVVALVVGASLYDMSATTSRSVTFKLVDKYHLEDCIPIYSPERMYLGKNCNDEWALIGLADGKRIKKEINEVQFNSFVIGDCIKMAYLEGKLGGIYQLRYAKTSC